MRPTPAEPAFATSWALANFMFPLLIFFLGFFPKKRNERALRRTPQEHVTCHIHVRCHTHVTRHIHVTPNSFSQMRDGPTTVHPAAAEGGIGRRKPSGPNSLSWPASHIQKKKAQQAFEQVFPLFQVFTCVSSISARICCFSKHFLANESMPSVESSFNKRMSMNARLRRGQDALNPKP